MPDFPALFELPGKGLSRWLVVVVLTWCGLGTMAESGETSIEAARIRAQLLHETIHGSLQVIHRDFFEEERSRKLPSQSLQDVFGELQRKHGIVVRWITVDADEMTSDHRPAGNAELEAVEKLKAGETSHEVVTAEALHFVGRIPLSSQCLKCHVKLRNSNRERSSGLSIRIPLSAPASPE